MKSGGWGAPVCPEKISQVKSSQVETEISSRSIREQGAQPEAEPERQMRGAPAACGGEQHLDFKDFDVAKRQNP